MYNANKLPWPVDQSLRFMIILNITIETETQTKKASSTLRSTIPIKISILEGTGKQETTREWTLRELEHDI